MNQESETFSNFNKTTKSNSNDNNNSNPSTLTNPPELQLGNPIRSNDLIKNNILGLLQAKKSDKIDFEAIQQLQKNENNKHPQ